MYVIYFNAKTAVLMPWLVKNETSKTIINIIRSQNELFF